jgi:regulator of nucleoside diphosphate kinase
VKNDQTIAATDVVWHSSRWPNRVPQEKHFGTVPRRRSEVMLRTILMTEDELWRLAQLIECALRFQPHSHQHLAELKEELNTARVVAQEEIPRDVVTLNSEVRVRDLDSRHESVYKIVFPRDAHVAENRISVLAPIGTALLGRRAGEIIELDVPIRKKRLKVQEVIRQAQAASQAA